MGVCCCLQTCNAVLNTLVMGLVLGPSLIVISIMVSCYMQRYLPFITKYGSTVLVVVVVVQFQTLYLKNRKSFKSETLHIGWVP